MSKNKTNITKENMAYITKLCLKSVGVILFRFIVLIIGIFSVLISIDEANELYPDYVEVVLCLISGAVLIFYSVYGISFVYRKKSIKASYIELLREYKINSTCIVVSMGNNKMKVTNEFLYSNFDLALKKMIIIILN